MNFIIGIVITQWIIVLNCLLFDVIQENAQEKRNRRRENMSPAMRDWYATHGIKHESFFPSFKAFMLNLIPFYFVLLLIRLIVRHFRK